MSKKVKKYIIPLLFISGFILSFYGFYFLEHKSFAQSFTNSLQMLVLNLPSDYQAQTTVLIASVIIAFAIFFTVISIFFIGFYNKILIFFIQRKKHITLFGLEDINKTFLDNTSNKNIIIVEKYNTIEFKEYIKKVMQ